MASFFFKIAYRKQVSCEIFFRRYRIADRQKQQLTHQRPVPAKKQRNAGSGVVGPLGARLALHIHLWLVNACLKVYKSQRRVSQ